MNIAYEILLKIYYRKLCNNDLSIDYATP